MTINRQLTVCLILCAVLLSSFTAHANNIIVTNVNLVNTQTALGTTDIQFDLSWKNSWRASWEEDIGGMSVAITNWDAAWVFVKFRVSGGEWRHAALSSTGHYGPAGVTVEPAATDGTNVGVFIYRSEQGSGDLNLNHMRLNWNYAGDGVLTTNFIDVSVHAIEMVYIPEGKFKVGSGGTESGSFTDGSWASGATIPFEITSEAALEIGPEAGKLWGTSQSGNNTIGSEGTLPAAFPKGFAAFYCMKYEITQGQYAEFLNMLTGTQAGNRFPDQAGNDRHTISRSGVPDSYTYTAEAPYVACNYLSYGDGAAYADWAGLRPMTELEYEKACRGPLEPVPDEYAWGTAGIASAQYTLADAGTASESIDANYNDTGTHGNANYDSTYPVAHQGPMRVGIFATDTSSRVRAGATYWGIMEMSGNLWERPVSAGLAIGRLFTGLTGDGRLSADGHADVEFWPGLSGGEVTGTDGAGIRGGRWKHATSQLCVSDRYYAAGVYATRYNTSGFRAIRQAP